MVKQVSIIIAMIAAILLLGFGGYRMFYRSDPGDSARVKELEIEIGVFQNKQLKAKMEIDKAKELAAKALEQSRLADARTEVFRSQATEWRGRYEMAIRERETLKRAQTGSEAVKELRRMGWVR